MSLVPDEGGVTTGGTTVMPGGVIDIQVTDGSSEVQVFVGGDNDGISVPVENGKASFEVPDTTPGGTEVTILGNKIPPGVSTVEVTSTN